MPGGTGPVPFPENRVHDESMEWQQAVDSGWVPPTQSEQYFGWALRDARNVLKDLTNLKSRPVDEIRSALLKHSQMPGSDSLFDLVPQIQTVLDDLQRRTGTGK